MSATASLTISELIDRIRRQGGHATDREAAAAVVKMLERRTDLRQQLGLADLAYLMNLARCGRGEPERYGGGWDEKKHPRDDHGRFIEKHELEAAKKDPKKAAELRARVTKPAERKKLDAKLNEKAEGLSLKDFLAQQKQWEQNKGKPAAPAAPVAEEKPTPAPAPTPAASAPSVQAKPGKGNLVSVLAAKLQDGDIEAKDLWAAADQHFGGTRAEGKYGPSDAYDALEAAVNKHLSGETDPEADLSEAIRQADGLDALVDRLPTQTNRSGNKDAYQQFSTPPHYAYATVWLANIKPGEVALEPSAGTGSLAIHAANAGAHVYTNELDPARVQHLRDVGFAHVSQENAEQIAGILPKQGVPTPSVVIMNPPFSQTAGRMGDKKELLTGAKHIEEALQMLAPGGRLVSIVGRGMTPDSGTYKDWFRKMSQKYTLRANVGVSGDVYKKYGTHFASRVLIFDKVQGGNFVTGEVDSIPGLMQLLEGVRNDRPTLDRPAPGEPSGPEVAGQSKGTAQLDDASTAPDVGVSEPRDAGRPQPPGGPEGASGAADGAAGSEGRGDVLSGLGGSASRDGGQPGSAVGSAGGSTVDSPAGDESRKNAPRSRKPARRKPIQQPVVSLPELRPASYIDVEAIEPKSATSKGALTESLYESYRPARLNIPGTKPHPSPLVESAAMAAVLPPKPTYRPVLSPDIISHDKQITVTNPDGTKSTINLGLTAAALESVVYAGQAHQQFLPAAEGEQPERRGYFIGDGTGAGKGRQIAGIMLDNINQGRKKHVWVTQKQNLYEDAERDLRDVGIPGKLFHFDKIRAGKAPDEGVAFITYDTLKNGTKDPTKPNNLDQLVAWLGPDFDGVIAFDEAHSMANALNTQGDRGMKDASKRALAGVALQKRMPKARVTYISATGATEVSNLAYADRLGIWGRGTPFADKQEFITSMGKGGVAAMEAVAQSLKATGSYAARSMSFDDGTPKGKVTYDRLTHHLSDDQRAVYDGLADGWQKVLHNIDKALEATGGSDSPEAKSAARSQFWGAQQRFFNQVMTSMQTPAVIKSMEDDLKQGRAPVVQLVNTMEASTQRALEKREDMDDLEDLDVSPRESLMQYLERSFPIHRYEKYVDEDGNESSRLVTDSKGDPVTDPEAEAIRDEMLDMVGSLRIPESPLDMIVNHFGHETVAEATGRTQRVISQTQDDGTRKKVLERRNIVNANAADASAFQAGKKKVMVFSDAGGTGRSYHADLTKKNQDQRVHYMLQPGWRADNAVQGLGRTHRTNQAQAPTYRLVEINELPAQRRFISTIARRLDQLGALTRGQRQTGSSGLFKAGDNLESPEAKDALGKFFRDLEHGRIEGLSHNEVMTQLGFKQKDDDKDKKRRQTPDAPPMGQFLNRLLSLRVDMQAKVFDAFDKRLQQTVEQAMREGTLDVGVENFPADKIKKESDRTVYRDPTTGAEARHISTIVQRKTEKRKWEENSRGELPLQYVVNKQSGRVWAVYKSGDKTNARTGDVVPQYVLRGPTSAHFRPTYDVQTGYNGNFTELSQEKAKEHWEKEFAEAPEYTQGEEHFLTGALLPIWDRIPGEQPKIYRLRTEDGQTMVGRHVPARLIQSTLKNLGVELESKGYSATDVHARLSKASGGTVATLANGWKIKPVRVQGEKRLELIGPNYNNHAELEKDGVIKERIAYNTRLFVPMGEDGANVLARITASRPITEVVDAGQYQREEAALQYAREFNTLLLLGQNVPRNRLCEASTALCYSRQSVAWDYSAGYWQAAPSELLRYAGGPAHAPKGGVHVQGKFYPGGEWIPGKVMDRATPDEKAAVKGNTIKPAGRATLEARDKGPGQSAGQTGKGRASGNKPIDPRRTQYHEHAAHNLGVMSRTAQGKVDTSASPDKAGQMAVGSGEQAAQLAKQNFETTIHSLHEQRGKQFSGPGDLMNFVDGIAASINKGITKEGVLHREHDSAKYPYTNVSHLPLARKQFAEELMQRLDRDDPVKTAAWIHWRANHTDHFWADGVGKTTEALADWVLMRHDRPLPKFRSRDEVFKHAAKNRVDPSQGSSAYTGPDYKNWERYYSGLMPDLPTNSQEAAAHLAKGLSGN